MVFPVILPDVILKSTLSSIHRKNTTEVLITNETVEKPDCNLAGIPDGVDIGGILFFLELTALSWCRVFLHGVTQCFSPSFNVLCKPIIEDLFHVVNHTIQQPLDIDLGFSSQGESIQSLVRLDIGKNGFDESQALRIYLASPLAINLCDHLFGKVNAFGSIGDIEPPTLAMLCPQALTS